jgi:hypothetical protein
MSQRNAQLKSLGADVVSADGATEATLAPS